jgi:hypothetical protein
LVHENSPISATNFLPYFLEIFAFPDLFWKKRKSDALLMPDLKSLENFQIAFFVGTVSRRSTLLPLLKRYIFCLVQVIYVDNMFLYYTSLRLSVYQHTHSIACDYIVNWLSCTDNLKSKLLMSNVDEISSFTLNTTKLQVIFNLFGVYFLMRYSLKSRSSALGIVGFLKACSTVFGLEVCNLKPYFV